MDKLLSIKDVSELLQVNERTILRLIQSNKIPARKIGNQWRFHPAQLETWFIEGDKNGIDTYASLSDRWKSEEEYQIFSQSRTLLDFKTRSSREVIEKMIQMLAETGHLLQSEIYRQAVLEREEISSTGIGGGVALPHGWHPINDLFRVPLIVSARLQSPIDFRSVDGRPVDLIFLLSAPRKIHLKLLSVMSSIAKQQIVMDKLRTVQNPSEFVTILNTAAKIEN